MSDLFPYEIPADAHRWAGFFVHAGGMTFDAEAVNALAAHVEKLGFIHLGDKQSRLEVVINIAIPDHEAHIFGELGKPIDWEIPDGWTSYCRVEGTLPPGLELSGDRIHGVCSIPGVWTVTIIIGPAIKFDGLGHAGAPLEPGEWIPIDKPRKPIARGAAGVDLTGLNPQDLDDIIAQAEAAKKDLEVTE